MTYSELVKIFSNPLIGNEAHAHMAPLGRGNTEDFLAKNAIQPKISAVLMLCYPKQESLEFLLMKRTTNGSVHSGQISFPGGKFEEADLNYEQTALRETEEEFGISRHQFKIISSLTRVYIPPSNFLVYPFIGFMEQTPTISISENEVEEIISVPILELNDHNKFEGEFYGTSSLKIKAPYFKLQNQQVWGATAVILSEVNEMIKKYHSI